MTDTIVYTVGKNAEDNWKIYRESSQTYTIFHLDKFSSAYVIVNVPMEELTNQQIYTAADLCKSRSKYKNIPNLGVMYTSISNTHLGDKPGAFIVNSNRKVKLVVI
jgi:predicted ribosome quality control (RQC) complex YloA/Tae2 family protein